MTSLSEATFCTTNPSRWLTIGKREALETLAKDYADEETTALLKVLGKAKLSLADGVRQVEYHHLLLPRHALIQAEGAWCESLYPGPMATAALGLAARASLARAVHDNAQGLDRTARDPTDLTGFYGPRCLRVLTRLEARDWLAASRPRHPERATAAPQLERAR